MTSPSPSTFVPSYPLSSFHQSQHVLQDDYRNPLVQNDNYISKQHFAVNSVEWRPAKNGHSVFDEDEEEPFKAIMVSNVTDFQLYVGPTGNYISPQYGSLAKAKYQFPLPPSSLWSWFPRSEMPAGQCCDDQPAKGYVVRRCRWSYYKNAQKRLRKLDQGEWCDERPRYKGTSRDEQGHEELGRSRELQDELPVDPIKPNYRAVPPRVYNDNNFVEPTNVQQETENALAEVTFAINHALVKKHKDTYDSFQAETEHLIILEKRSILTNKSINPHAGPSQTAKRKRGNRSENGLGGKKRETAVQQSLTRAAPKQTEPMIHDPASCVPCITGPGRTDS